MILSCGEFAIWTSLSMSLQREKRSRKSSVLDKSSFAWIGAISIRMLLGGATFPMRLPRNHEGDPCAYARRRPFVCRSPRTAYTFKIRTKQARVSVQREGSDFTLRIDVQDSDIEPQIIRLDGNDLSVIDDARIIQFESFDYDNDGFKDFSIRDSTSASPNEIRHYYFWLSVRSA